MIAGSCLLFSNISLGQTNDSISVSSDTIQNSQINQAELNEKNDTTATNPEKKSNPLLEAEVTYSAQDSTFFNKGKVYLFGNASVSYQDIQLTAHKIELDLDNNTAFAEGTVDSAGVEQGLPVFKDRSGEYTMRRMRYNFKTEKAIIEHVVTTQGEGFVVSERAKKNADNTYFLKDGRYTTCSNHDHPHYYIKMTKAKVIPGKKIITGPAYLVIEDVKIYPLMIPFAFVPTTSTYSSGFLMPSYGEESNRGFFLRDGGYYWAANDMFDLSITGDIYGNKSWGLRAASNYKKRYKYSGNFNIQRITNINSENGLPDYSKTNDFSITLSHRQDPKANPYSTLSASVNYSTSSFDKNNVGSIINPEVLAQNTKRSSISYSRQFPNSPFNMSVNALHSQNSRDTTISFTVPDLTLTMNRIYPLKRKNKVGSKEAWYETISMSYSGNFKNDIQTKESDLSFSRKSLTDDWRNGAKHSIPVSMNLKLLKYFTLTPNFNYNERWYFKSTNKEWDEDLQEIVYKDTIQGFNRVYDYNFGVSTSTKIYTFFRPSKVIFGDKIEALRHVMTPSVSFSYRPDFADEKYGYYDSFEYYDEDLGKTVVHEYSLYENSIYGVPGSGESGSMSFSLANSLEMKVKSEKDSTGFKKVKILESLNLSSSYNFLAEEFNLSNIILNGRTKVFGTNLSFGANFDPYALDTSSTTSGVLIVDRINTFEWNSQNRLARLQTANLSFGFGFGSENFKKDKDKNEEGDINNNAGIPENNDPFNNNNNQDPQQPPTNNNTEPLEVGQDGYAKFDIPWNVSFNYNMRLIPDEFDAANMAYKHKLTADISMNGSISLTKKWDLNLSTGYNLEEGEISHTNLRVNRNLHCWNMSFNISPFGLYKSFFFSIAINSSLLRDLKYDKRSHARDNPNWL